MQEGEGAGGEGAGGEGAGSQGARGQGCWEGAGGGGSMRATWMLDAGMAVIPQTFIYIVP